MHLSIFESKGQNIQYLRHAKRQNSHRQGNHLRVWNPTHTLSVQFRCNQAQEKGMTSGKSEKSRRNVSSPQQIADCRE